MSLKTRLHKLENTRATAATDLTKLSDDELLVSTRQCVEELGMDWDMFTEDPIGITKEFFKHYQQDEPVYVEFLHALSDFDPRWLRVED